MATDDPDRPARSRRQRLLSVGRRALRGLMNRAPAIPATARIRVTSRDGQLVLDAEVDTGDTLLRIARSRGVDISSYCGGQCSCGTCRVQITGPTEGLSPWTPNEKMVLGDAQVRAGERLACQARLVGDVEIQLLDLY